MPKRAVKRASSAKRVEPEGGPLFVNSIQKGFVVLKAFSREQPRLTLAQVTRMTGLDKSAAQRFLFTLHELGYLAKDEETKQYSLSPRLLEFGYAYLYSDRIIERAQPFLVEAQQKTGETVNLAVMDGTDIILVSRLPSRHVVSLNIQIGLRIPAVYSASGLVMIAALPLPERERLLRAVRLQAHTANSIVDRETLRKTLDQAARDGHAIVHGQYFQGDISVAVAVTDASGHPVGAVSISAPDSRITLEKAREVFLPAAMEAARKTSVAMGAY